MHCPDISRSALNVAAAAVVLIMSTGDSLGADDRLTAAERAVAANAASEHGKAYGAAIGQAFGTAHRATIGSCAKENKPPNLSTFSLYLRVGAGGVVEEALAEPETNIAACLRGRLSGWRAPPPPSVGFWVKIGVNLKPERR